MRKVRQVGRVNFGIFAAVLVSLMAINAYAGDSCTYQVWPLSVSVANDKAVEVEVTASGPDCSFTAESDTSWITVTPAHARGSGVVRLDMAPSIDPTVGTVRIAGKRVTVFQKGLVDSYGVTW
jgi:hypothetical protein